MLGQARVGDGVWKPRKGGWKRGTQPWTPAQIFWFNITSRLRKLKVFQLFVPGLCLVLRLVRCYGVGGYY